MLNFSWIKIAGGDRILDIRGPRTTIHAYASAEGISWATIDTWNHSERLQTLKSKSTSEATSRVEDWLRERIRELDRIPWEDMVTALASELRPYASIIEQGHEAPRFLLCIPSYGSDRKDLAAALIAMLDRRVEKERRAREQKSSSDLTHKEDETPNKEKSNASENGEDYVSR